MTVPSLADGSPDAVDTWISSRCACTRLLWQPACQKAHAQLERFASCPGGAVVSTRHGWPCMLAGRPGEALEAPCVEDLKAATKNVCRSSPARRTTSQRSLWLHGGGNPRRTKSDDQFGIRTNTSPDPSSRPGSPRSHVPQPGSNVDRIERVLPGRRHRCDLTGHAAVPAYISLRLSAFAPSETYASSCMIL